MIKTKMPATFLTTTAAVALLLGGAATADTTVKTSTTEKSDATAPIIVAASDETKAEGTDSVRKPVDTVYQVRASEIIGKPIENLRGEKLGTVDDLIVAKQDKVTYAIVSVGGFLGIGDKLVAVQFDELQMRPKDALVLNVTKKQLENEPEFHFANARTNYETMAAREYDDWKAKVSDFTAKAKQEGRESRREAADKLDEAWAEVEEQWRELKEASGDAWQDARAEFEEAWSNFEQAWRVATTES